MIGSVVGSNVFLVYARHYLGTRASLELPSKVVLAQGWLSAFFLLFTLFSFICVSYLIIHKYVHIYRKKSSSTFSPSRRHALIGIVAACTTTYGTQQGTRIAPIHDLEIELPKLPEELDGLRIVQISDLHISALFEKNWCKDVVSRINAAKPDIIVFTGDMIDGVLEARKNDITPLKNLFAPYGIYACLGNHEYYGDFSNWMQAFADMNIKVLSNEHQVLSIKGQQLVIAGVTDIEAKNFNLPTPDPQKALANAPENAVRIMLDHRPGYCKLNALAGVDLQLSGHTHGGQTYGLKQITKQANNNYNYGWYHVEGMPLYVTSGAALWSGFPFRLGVPSEIPRITLRSAKKNGFT